MKMSKKEGRAVLLAAIVSTFGAGGANANAVYTYTGNDFTTVTPPSDSVYTTLDFVALTLTLTEPLPGNLNLVSIIPEVADFHISDGFFSYDLGGYPATLFESPILDFSTNATGDITNWAVSLTAAPSVSGSTIETFNTPTQIFDRAQILFGCPGLPPPLCTASNANSPGIWTAVPAPTIGAGIPGLVAGCGGLLVWWLIRRPRRVEPPLTSV